MIGRGKVRSRIARERFREWLFFDSRIARAALAIAAYLVGISMLWAGRNDRGAAILAQAHRANALGIVDRAIERLFKRALDGASDRLAKGVRTAIASYPENVPVAPHTRQFLDDPDLLLNGCSLVLKSPAANEKGVLYLYYSYVYPFFVRAFNMNAITQRYRIVLEPSWSGFCDMNVLSLAILDQSIVVGAGEARDARFLRSVSTKLIPSDFTGNTWVDTDRFRPLPGVTKDIDVIVIAAWAWYKRHWAIFRALKTLRKKGHKLQVALVGYPIDMTAEDILGVARHYGVEDQIELHENVPHAAINQLLNRSKVNLLWSRREGSNRAIAEGMAADVPCILRKGFNYGESYPHINPATGRFADEGNLTDVLLEMIAHTSRGEARSWMMTRMTPIESTRRLNQTLKDVAASLGESWTQEAVVKVSQLSGLAYLEPADSERFEADNAFLSSQILGRGRNEMRHEAQAT
jgi:glycosyltransferase involved in cell wall biosynthesis